MPLAIDTDRLTKFYGTTRGVEELDLDVREGEVFGFLGPNGAGKSTTINLLMDQIRPTSGRATVLGLDSHTDHVAVHARVGFLPGELALYERLTGREILTYLANLRRGVPADRIGALADRFAAELDRPVRGLSMGNKQKLGLIQAFMHDPDLLILDEPTIGLDPLVQREFQHLVREVVAAGRTVFLSSHTLSEVERVADRVGIIRDGRLVEVAEVARLKSLAVRRIELIFDVPPDPTGFQHIAGAREVVVDDHALHVHLEGPMAELLKIAADHEVQDIRTHEADLEEVFLAFYRDRESREGGDGR
jgi:ABC-2 type transport system ATP-binding protein